MINVRLARSGDEEQLETLGRRHYSEQQPGSEFDSERANRTFVKYLNTANPTIFVAEDENGVVGFLLATIHDYAAKSGHFTRQEVLYVIPEKRGSRAAAKLITNYYLWAEQIGASESFSGLAVDEHLERNIRFFERFGFELVGVTLRRKGD